MGSPGQPNILIMMTDQQRFDSMGCYGCAAAHTPNLDHFAAEGVLFERCYVNNPLCTPSRASMMTGKHLQEHGVYRLYDNLPQDQVLFTERLQRLGYQTALFGKLHVSASTLEQERRHPHDGFDIYEWCLGPSSYLDSPFNGYAAWLKKNDPEFLERLHSEGEQPHVPLTLHMTHWAADRTIEFIQQERDPDRPFCCIMSVHDPHDPYHGFPLEMRELIDATKIPDPLVVEGELERPPRILKRLHENTEGKMRPETPLADIRKARFGYHASMALVDREFGRVFDMLDQTGLAEDTLVIYTSDHGDLLGDHQQYIKGAALYDPCVRVPFIMRWPARFAGGQRLAQLVQPHDIAATALAAAGVSNDDLASSVPDSVDLSRLCAGETATAHDYAYCLYRNSGISRLRTRSFYYDPPIHATMIRGERFKLVMYHALNSGQETEGQLFDMVADPLETRNLWDDQSYYSVRVSLTETLTNWLVAQEIRSLGGRGGGSRPRWWEGPLPGLGESTTQPDVQDRGKNP